jgi:hypothetical protein
MRLPREQALAKLEALRARNEPPPADVTELIAEFLDNLPWERFAGRLRDVRVDAAANDGISVKLLYRACALGIEQTITIDPVSVRENLWFSTGNSCWTPHVCTPAEYITTVAEYFERTLTMIEEEERKLSGSGT